MKEKLKIKEGTYSSPSVMVMEVEMLQIVCNSINDMDRDPDKELNW